MGILGATTQDPICSDPPIQLKVVVPSYCPVLHLRQINFHLLEVRMSTVPLVSS